MKSCNYSRKKTKKVQNIRLITPVMVKHKFYLNSGVSVLPNSIAALYKPRTCAGSTGGSVNLWYTSRKPQTSVTSCPLRVVANRNED